MTLENLSGTNLTIVILADVQSGQSNDKNLNL